MAPVRINTGHQYTVLLKLRSDSSGLLLSLAQGQPAVTVQLERERVRGVEERGRGRKHARDRYRISANVKVGEFRESTANKPTNHSFSLCLN